MANELLCLRDGFSSDTFCAAAESEAITMADMTNIRELIRDFNDVKDAFKDTQAVKNIQQNPKKFLTDKTIKALKESSKELNKSNNESVVLALLIIAI